MKYIGKRLLAGVMAFAMLLALCGFAANSSLASDDIGIEPIPVSECTIVLYKEGEFGLFKSEGDMTFYEDTEAEVWADYVPEWCENWENGAILLNGEISREGESYTFEDVVLQGTGEGIPYNHIDSTDYQERVEIEISGDTIVALWFSKDGVAYVFDNAEHEPIPVSECTIVLYKEGEFGLFKSEGDMTFYEDTEAEVWADYVPEWCENWENGAILLNGEISREGESYTFEDVALQGTGESIPYAHNDSTDYQERVEIEISGDTIVALWFSKDGMAYVFDNTKHEPIPVPENCLKYGTNTVYTGKTVDVSRYPVHEICELFGATYNEEEKSVETTENTFYFKSDGLIINANGEHLGGGWDEDADTGEIYVKLWGAYVMFGVMPNNMDNFMPTELTHNEFDGLTVEFVVAFA